MFEGLQVVTLSITLLVAGSAMAVFWFFGQRKLHQMQARLQQQNLQIETMRNDVRALFSGAVGGDSRLHKLESRVRRITERQEQIENNKQTERPYEQAIRMVHQGSKVEDIMAVCNLSKGEADLIIMMHRADKADKADAESAENFH